MDKSFEVRQDKIPFETNISLMGSSSRTKVHISFMINHPVIKGCASPYITEIQDTYICGYTMAKELAEQPSPLEGYENLLALVVAYSVGDNMIIDVDVNGDGGLDRVYLTDDNSVFYRCYDSELMEYRNCRVEELNDGISIIFKLEGVWVNIVDNSQKDGGI